MQIVKVGPRTQQAYFAGKCGYCQCEIKAEPNEVQFLNLPDLSAGEFKATNPTTQFVRCPICTQYIVVRFCDWPKHPDELDPRNSRISDLLDALSWRCPTCNLLYRFPKGIEPACSRCIAPHLRSSWRRPSKPQVGPAGPLYEMSDRSPTESEKLSAGFHAAWSACVGTSGYNKDVWMAAETQLLAAKTHG